MEGFTYTDIYATKGVEYVLILGFLFLLIGFWRVLQSERMRPVRAAAAAAGRRFTDMIEGFFVPDGVYFHFGHTWVKVDGKDTASIGMDDFAQKLAGKLDMIEFPGLDQGLKQGEKAWTLRFGAKAVNMLSPVDGVVTALNREAIEAPETVNSDPYGKGWLIKVKSPNLRTDLKNLLSGSLARKWVEESMENLRMRSGAGLGLVLQDGGVPADGIARNVDREKWDDLMKDFFLTAE